MENYDIKNKIEYISNLILNLLIHKNSAVYEELENNEKVCSEKNDLELPVNNKINYTKLEEFELRERKKYKVTIDNWVESTNIANDLNKYLSLKKDMYGLDFEKINLMNSLQDNFLDLENEIAINARELRELWKQDIFREYINRISILEKNSKMFDEIKSDLEDKILKKNKENILLISKVSFLEKELKESEEIKNSLDDVILEQSNKIKMLSNKYESIKEKYKNSENIKNSLLEKTHGEDQKVNFTLKEKKYLKETIEFLSNKNKKLEEEKYSNDKVLKENIKKIKELEEKNSMLKKEKQDIDRNTDIIKELENKLNQKTIFIKELEKKIKEKSIVKLEFNKAKLRFLAIDKERRTITSKLKDIKSIEGMSVQSIIEEFEYNKKIVGQAQTSDELSIALKNLIIAVKNIDNKCKNNNYDIGLNKLINELVQLVELI